METELTEIKGFDSIKDLYKYIKNETKDNEDTSCTLQTEDGVFECETIEDAFKIMILKMMIESSKSEWDGWNYWWFEIPTMLWYCR